ncbi:MAG: insulinase family protein [Gemmatimonadetes bacterium]|nr:insulinase family protein [Gemmatimonadota bacterium]
MMREMRGLGVLVAAALAPAACARTAPAPVPTPTPATASVATAAVDTPAAPRVAVDRSRPPELGPPPSLRLPPVETRTLSNGLTLYIVEQHELPLVDLVLLVKSGSEADPAGRAGLATLVADMLMEGTTSRTGLEVADQAAYLGIELDAGATWDASRVTLHAPTAQLDSALALFADVALHPRFAVADLERLRKERLTTLIQLRDRPSAIADQAFASIVFGAGHAYGRSTLGTEATTRAITRADLQRFYAQHYRPNNAALLVVGDVDPDAVSGTLERLVGAWKPAPVPESAVGSAPAPRPTTVYLIDKPGAPQSSIRIGGIGVPRSTPDYFAIQVMNTILGGSFTSRLNQNLREVHGYTYGAGSGFGMRREAGPFVARAEVTGTKTDSSLVQFLKELNAIRDDTVPTAELEKAKRYIQLGLPADFETTRDVASQLVPVVLYGLPLDYYGGYIERVGRVTQADVQRVARRYIDPAHLTIVVVGDRKSIEPGVRALNAGAVEVRAAAGAAR